MLNWIPTNRSRGTGAYLETTLSKLGELATGTPPCYDRGSGYLDSTWYSIAWETQMLTWISLPSHMRSDIILPLMGNRW
jgi:hypothetical protein